MVENLVFTEQQNRYEVNLAENGKLVYWLEIFPEQDLLIHKWIGFLTDDALIEIWLYTLNFVEQRRGFRHKSIADTSELIGSFDGINQFIADTVLPRVLAGGFKYSAYVLPKDFYAMLATQFYQEETKEMPFVTKYFDEVEKAKEWLRSLNT